MNDPESLKFVFVIILSIFALISTGSGLWLAKKAVDQKHEGAGWGALLCFIATLAILGAAGTAAGVKIDLFK